MVEGQRVPWGWGSGRRVGSAVVRKVNGIQALRAVAALAVVFHHALIISHEHANGLNPLRIGAIGRAGVDLFFVISGLIMVMITVHPRAPGDSPWSS
jgi:peptidoglycan/LPS O-acetylase OafA/YrhL